MAGACGLFVRIVVYIAVIGGSSAVLYGIVTSQDEIKPKEVFDNSNCLLFGKWFTLSSTIDGKFFAGGGNGWCKFVEFAAASQLGLAVLMTIAAVLRLVRIRASRDGARSSVSSMIELFFVVPAFVVAVAGASVVSAGLALACSRLRDDWDKSIYYKNGYTSKPSSCTSAWVFVGSGNSGKQYKFYNDLNIAQIGMWITCAWLFHIILSIIAVRSGRKAHAAETDAFASNESYKKMTEPM